jgi:hypothetical protein
VAREGIEATGVKRLLLELAGCADDAAVANRG